MVPNADCRPLLLVSESDSPNVPVELLGFGGFLSHAHVGMTYEHQGVSFRLAKLSSAIIARDSEAELKRTIQ